MTGPYFNKTEAAHYCGYKSADAFGKELKEFDLPKYGPKKNRFAAFDLDVWMKEPEKFKKREQIKAPKRKSRAPLLLKV